VRGGRGTHASVIKWHMGEGLFEWLLRNYSDDSKKSRWKELSKEELEKSTKAKNSITEPSFTVSPLLFWLIVFKFEFRSSHYSTTSTTATTQQQQQQQRWRWEKGVFYWSRDLLKIRPFLILINFFLRFKKV